MKYDPAHITKQEAANILRHCSATDPDLSRCDTCIAARRCDEYFAAIAELLDKETCRGIPVTERLPEPARQLIAKPVNNIGRIRGMSDSEIAAMLAGRTICPPHSECALVSGDCEACWMNWFQQVPEEG